jgi:hypothetical protein
VAREKPSCRGEKMNCASCKFYKKEIAKMQRGLKARDEYIDYVENKLDMYYKEDYASLLKAIENADK